MPPFRLEAKEYGLAEFAHGPAVASAENSGNWLTPKRITVASNPCSVATWEQPSAIIKTACADNRHKHDVDFFSPHHVSAPPILP